MKICRACLLPKSFDEFPNNTWYKDGKQPLCYQCYASYVRVKCWARGVHKPRQPFLNRLWDNIQQCGHEDLCVYCCWPWLKSYKRGGYGKITLFYGKIRRTSSVSRIIYEIWHGVHIPDDIQVCHHCDFPPCVNPSHLWLGTGKENAEDCVAKGRRPTGVDSWAFIHSVSMPRGESHGNARFTNQDILDIRARYAHGESIYSLRKDYAASKYAITCNYQAYNVEAYITFYNSYLRGRLG